LAETWRTGGFPGPPVITDGSCASCYELSCEIIELRKAVEALQLDLEQTLDEREDNAPTRKLLAELRAFLAKVAKVDVTKEPAGHVTASARVSGLVARLARNGTMALWHAVANELANAITDELKRKTETSVGAFRGF